MINKIHTFGCSFSFQFWIDETETYTHKLSEKLNTTYSNNSFPGICHNEAYHRLVSSMESFNKNDLIIYQFTSGNRQGFMLNDNFYYSSAGICSSLKETTDIMNNWGGGRNLYPFNDDKLLSLMSYLNDWGNDDLFYKYNRVDKLLKFLKNKIGINYYYLFLDDSFKNFADSDSSIDFKLDDSTSTISIKDWICENKLTLKDSNPNFPLGDDMHPNEIAHQIISDMIYNKLN
jgi:lysophospholipase L1-like esterase